MANSSVIKYAECACVSLVHSFHVTFMCKLVNLQTFNFSNQHLNSKSA